jgi:hypothetical protein
MQEWREQEAALAAQLAAEEDRLQGAARVARERGWDAAYDDGEAPGGDTRTQTTHTISIKIHDM